MKRLSVAMSVLVAVGVVGLSPVAARADTPPSTLPAGDSLATGASLVSPDGDYTIVVQSDGNLVVYGPSGATWATGTHGSGASLAMQSDGNLVLYAGGAALFATATSGSGTDLVMQDDGNAVVYDGAGHALWSARTGTLPPSPSVTTQKLEPGQSLPGDGSSVVSPNASYRAVMQGDGNFVVYGPTGASFATRTSDARASAVLQSDGNFVIYSAGGLALFATGTSGADSELVMQDDGNLVEYVGGAAAWSSRTGLVPPPGQDVASPLNGGQSIAGGGSVDSGNGAYRLVMQTDGNLVLYGPSGARFASGTAGSDPELVMQNDGNLVVYAGGRAVWATGTTGTNPYLAVQDDGNAVVYASGRAVWTSSTGRLPIPSFPGTGAFRVGVDIAPGTYRERSAPARPCYWERDSDFSGSDDSIIANNTQDGPDVVTIAPSDAQFKTDDCTTWTQDLSAITTSVTAPFGDGTWIVGTDIAPGTWHAPGGGECYWERDSDFSGTFDAIIDNDVNVYGPTVTIAASDAGFRSDGCGTWTKVG